MTLRDRLARLDIAGAPYLFIAPFFILFGIFGLFPLGYTLWVSLHDWSLLAGDQGFVGLANYSELLGDDYFWNSLLNTFAIFLIATIPQILMALGLAQVLNTSLRAITFWRMGVVLPIVTSVAAVGIIFSMIFARDFGLANWLLSLVGVDPIAWNQERLPSWIAIATMVDWRWTGYNALILLAALQAVPKELYESARLDGAGAVRQWWSITIPMLRPTLVFVVTVATIGGIQLFTEPLLFNPGANAITGGELRQFQTSTMYLVEEAFTGQRFGYASTIAWALFIVIVLVSLINSVIVRRIRSVD
ncbi:cellobiose transport system permease protein [Mumia flava]|uniref:Cellobiose transport system permease protein n=1 Tax=Mumia flava TaxID=1348852 RepID=A0A2M9BIX7_9ACTN|nr:sugar ABC transporter permease [Mumia flava]PJJ57893.1 cellobiose transport system permease protein [Mumia flava]